MSHNTAPSDAAADAASDTATAMSSAATMTKFPKLTLERLFSRPAPFVFQQGVTDPVRTAETAPWIIYRLVERATGRIYIGLSERTLAKRIGAHLSEARRGDPACPDGLKAALRAMDAGGQTFADAFDAQVVARALTAEEAAEQECRWIEMLACRTPHGLNSMPGGGVGSVSNSRELTVETSPGAHRYHPSIYHAIGRRNGELRDARQPLLDPSVVYTRLSAGWPPEEALGYREHVDERSRRAPFLFNGREFATLRQASRASGIPVATLRSRHQRQATRCPSDGPVDIGTDRRAGNGSADRELLAILWPDTGEQLTADTFAERTGVPKASVIHRWHRARAWEAEQGRQGRPPLSPEELVARLTTTTDRRKPVTLVLPDGRRWVGGERELVRRVLADRALEAQRPERLFESGIRQRLRALSEADRQQPHLVRQAFGFACWER